MTVLMESLDQVDIEGVKLAVGLYSSLRIIRG
jgi:hypothetical protein